MTSARFRPVPQDGTAYVIEAWPLVIDWLDAPPRAPRPPQSVRGVPGAGFERYAVDSNGWVYYRYDYPYGWVTAGHVADFVVNGLQALCRA